MNQELLVGYVVKGFPLPSETFVADEAASLRQAGARAVVLHLQAGDTTVIHASANALLNEGATRLLEAKPRRQVLAALLQLMLRRPFKTIYRLFSVSRNPDRWRHARAIPHAAWCLEFGVDYLHAHFADLNLEYAAIISAWSGIPYGLTTHRYDLFEDPLDPKSASRLMQGAALHVTISEFNKGVLADKFGVPASKVHVIHCGVDLSRFTFVPRLGFDNSRSFRLLNVGRLAPVKGHDVLIRALALLETAGRRVETRIVGSGPEQARLQAMIAELGLQERVVLLGAQRHETIQQMLSEADAFVLASHVEGIPVACMEAMARGIPTIVTRTNGVPELIDHERTGLLTPPNDPAAIADAVTRLMDNPEEALNMARAARHKIESEFDRRSCTDQLVTRIRSVIEGRA